VLTSDSHWSLSLTSRKQRTKSRPV
jgi:hypothetical protein